ncbi:hypothetical protein, partial [Azospirillum sp. TSO35-2]|uniref:hypothetical protein n=1 Tax=Azospirillum sp. TSO35-2 TaxID=716796 RepID=UPI001FFEA256
MRSLLFEPLSEPDAKAKPIGAATVVSMVIASPVEAVELLPATSTAVALSVCPPSPKVALVIDHTPLPFAVPVPRTVVPSYKVTTLLASAVPVTDGATTLVRRSLLFEPLSEPDAKAKPVGAATVVSMVTASPLDAVEVLPATSTAVA